ncbi:hypothetical protein T08_1997 [Trichinella sp. T8]|nr:hypothetical protein T08_1997 [Trichinella sp. T8]
MNFGRSKLRQYMPCEYGIFWCCDAETSYPLAGEIYVGGQPSQDVLMNAANPRHPDFYELLQLLIDEQGSTETLIQQVTSGRVTARDLQIKNKKYEELQQRITALTAEYNGGTRTLEQFLRAVAYLVPEGENY